MGFPGVAVSKELACQCKRHGFNPWVRKIPWNRKWQPTPVFLSGKSHGQRSLVGYSPWGHKELNATEHVMKGLKKKSLQKLLGGGRGMSLEAWQRSTCVRVRVTSEFDLYCRGSGLQLSQRKRFPALDHPFCTPSPTAASGKMLAWVVKQ